MEKPVQPSPPLPPPSPEGGAAELSDILDTKALQSMLDAFSELEHVGMAIVDLRGTVLAATGWQDVCTKFHRVHPEACRHCQESDVALTKGVAPGAFKLYRCKNGLWDMATPIVVGERHVGNFFLGQFFFDDEQPDVEFFRVQARRYGFDETDYLAALDRVPRWSREKIDRAMTFCARLATQISELGYRNLQLRQAIADQKRAEENLRDSTQVIEGIIHAIPARVFWKDRNLAYLGCNAAFARDAGFASPQDVVGKDDFQMGWREQAESYRADDRQVIESGRAKLLIEEPETTPDGQTLALLTSKIPLRNAKGDVVGVLGTYLDVTDHKRAEKALQESEEQYRLLVDNAQEAIYVVQDGKVAFANALFAQLADMDAADVIGTSTEEFVAPEDRAGIREHLRRLVAGEKPEGPLEIRVRTRKGAERWMSINAARILWQGQPATLNFAADVTARKRAEERLRLHAQLLDSVTESVVASDLEGRILYWGRGAEKLYGYAAADVMGQPYRKFAGAIDPPDEEAFRKEILAKGSWQGEHLQKNRAGQTFWTSTQIALVRNEQGQPNGYIGIDQDVTARKQAEEGLQESEARYRTFTNTTSDLVFLKDETFRYLISNRANSAFLGKAEADVIGRTDFDLMPAEVAEHCRASDQKALLAGTSVSAEEPVGDRVFQTVKFPVPLPGGRTGVGGFIRDVTDRKQAEEKLQASTERFRDIAANIPGAIYQLQTGRTGALEVSYMSSGCEALFGRPLVGLDFTGMLFDHMHVGDRALFEHSLAKAAEQMERWSLEFRIAPPEGSAKWLRGSANPRQTPPGGILWNGVLLDITELKRTEESLREREAFQNLLMDTIPTPVFYKDRQGRYLGFNKAFETLYGMTKAQLVGKSVFDVAPPELAKIYHAKDVELFERPGTQVYEVPIQDVQGNRRDIVLHKASIVNAQGAVSGLIGIMLDVTQRKQAEEQMAKHLDELRRWQTVTLGREGRVAEMKREVNALSVRLGQPPPYPSAEGTSPEYSPRKIAMHA